MEDDSEEPALFRTPADISKVHQRMGDEDAGSDTESQHRDTVEEKRVKGVRWDPELGSEEEEDEDKEEDGRISEKSKSGQSKEITISDQAPLVSKYLSRYGHTKQIFTIQGLSIESITLRGHTNS